MSPGRKAQKARKRERERAAYAAAIAALPSGASCTTCEHVDRVRHKPKMACLLETDFYGAQIVTPEHKCPLWRATKA